VTKKRGSTESDNDCADAWLALAESADAGVSNSIRRTIYREAARDPVRVLRWLTSALLLRDLGAVEPDIGFFCIAFATECIAESRHDRDPELRRIDSAVDAIALANGAGPDDYDFIADQPPDVRALNKEWGARADAIEVEVLQDTGALEEADLRRQGFPFAERREAGRWALFGESDPLLNIDDDEFDDGKGRDPFLA
jgi:hypothetical protein